METCKVCGEKGIKEDTENGRKIRVCTECGAMDSDGDDLTNENPYEGTTAAGTSGSVRPQGLKPWMRDKNASSKGLISGKMLIKNIGSQLKFSESIIQDAVSLLDKVYEEEMTGKFKESRKAMCLACLYSAAKLNHSPISVRDFSFFLDITHAPEKFGAALKCLKSKYDVHLPPVNIEDQTLSLIQRSDLPVEVVERTRKLMLLLQKVFMTQGRSCLTTALPCAYLAWKSTDIINYRKVAYKDFCKRFRFKYSVKIHKKEIENAVIKMAEELPWIKGQKVKYPEAYLQDIIRYQESLIAKSVQTAVNQLEVDSDENSQGIEMKVSDVKDREDIFRQKPKPRKSSPDEITDKVSPVKKMKTEHGSSKPAKTTADSGLESLELGSDDDTEQYILSLCEIQRKQKVLEKFSIFKNENDSTSSVDQDGPPAKKSREAKERKTSKAERKPEITKIEESNENSDGDDEESDDDTDSDKEYKELKRNYGRPTEIYNDYDFDN